MEKRDLSAVVRVRRVSLQLFLNYITSYFGPLKCKRFRLAAAENGRGNVVSQRHCLQQLSMAKEAVDAGMSGRRGRWTEETEEPGRLGRRGNARWWRRGRKGDVQHRWSKLRGPAVLAGGETAGRGAASETPCMSESDAYWCPAACGCGRATISRRDDARLMRSQLGFLADVTGAWKCRRVAVVAIDARATEQMKFESTRLWSL